MASYILALDQGTTSSRAIVFDHSGGIVAVAQQEFPQILPAPGHVEHNPNDIWESQLTVAKQALQNAAITAEQVAAIGITNQRETTILWDKSTGTGRQRDRLAESDYGSRLRATQGRWSCGHDS